MFHRLKIRTEAGNVPEIYKNLEEVLRHLESSTAERSDLGTFVVPSPDGDSEAMCWTANFDKF